LRVEVPLKYGAHMTSSSPPARGDIVRTTPFQRLLAILFLVAALLATTSETASAISFIDSPSPTCRRIKGNQCAITFYYFSVSADPNYMIYLRLLLGNKVVFHTGGFFQTSMYVPYNMIGDILVPCGKEGSVPDPVPAPTPGSGPYPYGSSYGYTIQAGDSANLKSANYGTVYCPAK
jgi:hypothetical protein